MYLTILVFSRTCCPSTVPNLYANWQVRFKCLDVYMASPFYQVCIRFDVCQFATCIPWCIAAWPLTADAMVCFTLACSVLTDGPFFQNHLFIWAGDRSNCHRDPLGCTLPIGPRLRASQNADQEATNYKQIGGSFPRALVRLREESVRTFPKPETWVCPTSGPRLAGVVLLPVVWAPALNKSVTLQILQTGWKPVSRNLFDASKKHIWIWTSCPGPWLCACLGGISFPINQIETKPPRSAKCVHRQSDGYSPVT